MKEQTTMLKMMKNQRKRQYNKTRNKNKQQNKNKQTKQRIR